MRGILFSLVMACTLPTLCACRADETSPCSAPEVTATVKTLVSGDNSGNPAAALLLDLAKVTFSLDAIRTISSSTNQVICEARLTIKTNVPRPTPDPHDPNAQPETAEQKAFADKIFQQRGTEVKEITYKVEKTDDGQNYIAIIPSQTDLINQQNAAQQERERQYELQQQENRQFELDDQRNEEMQRRYEGGQ